MGLTHSEYKFYKGKFYLIEAGARGGGSNLSGKIVPYMSGVDNYEYLIKEALGQSVDQKKLDQLHLPEQRCVVMRFFDFGEGIVQKVYGKEYLKHNASVIDYQLEIHEGDKLENPKYGRLRPGHFIVGAETYEEAQKLTQDILENVHVVFEV